MSGTRKATRPPRKRTYRRGGLVPTYRGFAPRQFARGEWKFLDTTLSAPNGFSTTATMTLLNGLQPGSSASQRIGQKVTIKSIQIKLAADMNANFLPTLCRWFLVVDRQSNGAAPAAITDILNAASPYALRNLDNRKRFKILLDKTRQVADHNNAGSNGVFWNVYMKFRRPFIVEYNAGVAGTVADIVSNSLYLMTIADQAPGATCPNLYGKARIRYTDM